MTSWLSILLLVVYCSSVVTQ